MVTYFYACKTKGPNGLSYMHDQPSRWWKPIQGYMTPRFIFPSKLDDNNAAMVPSYFFWPRILNKLIFATRAYVLNDNVTKLTNIPSSIDYVPYSELLTFFETAQVIRLEIIPGQIVQEVPVEMTSFKTLSRSLNKLRRDMENKELI